MKQQINDHLLATEDNIVIYTAPDLSEDIWQNHQNKKGFHRHQIAAIGISLISYS